MLGKFLKFIGRWQRAHLSLEDWNTISQSEQTLDHKRIVDFFCFYSFSCFTYNLGISLGGTGLNNFYCLYTCLLLCMMYDNIPKIIVSFLVVIITQIRSLVIRLNAREVRSNICTGRGLLLTWHIQIIMLISTWHF